MCAAMAWFIELFQGMVFVLMAYLSVAHLVAARSPALPATGVASDLSTAEKAEDASPPSRHRSRDEGLAGSLQSCAGLKKSTTNDGPTPCNTHGDVRRLARHLALQGVDAKLVAAAVQGFVAGRHIRASTVLPSLPQQQQQQQRRQEQQQQQLEPVGPSGSGALSCVKTERGSKLRRRARRAAARQQQQPPSATSPQSQQIATKASFDDRVSPETLSASWQKEEQQQQRQQQRHSPTASPRTPHPSLQPRQYVHTPAWLDRPLCDWPKDARDSYLAQSEQATDLERRFGPPPLVVADPRQQKQKHPKQPQMEQQQKQPLRQSGRLTSKRQQDSRPHTVR